jgi:hypothetical protein
MQALTPPFLHPANHLPVSLRRLSFDFLLTNHPDWSILHSSAAIKRLASKPQTPTKMNATNIKIPAAVTEKLKAIGSSIVEGAEPFKASARKADMAVGLWYFSKRSGERLPYICIACDKPVTITASDILDGRYEGVLIGPQSQDYVAIQITEPAAK